MDHALLNAFVASCIGLLVLAFGFLARQWIIGIKESNQRLSDALDRAMAVLTTVERELDRHSMKLDHIQEDLAEVQEDLAEVQDAAAAPCPRPGCPMRSHAMGTLGPA